MACKFKTVIVCIYSPPALFRNNSLLFCRNLILPYMYSNFVLISDVSTTFVAISSLITQVVQEPTQWPHVELLY